jgi:hypothetical protein
MREFKPEPGSNIKKMLKEVRGTLMPVVKHLIPGENVLAIAGDFYATNKRLIRYRERFHGEEVDDIAYSHISSITYISGYRVLLIDIGIVLAVLGIIGIVVNIFTDLSLVTPLCAVATFVGIVLIIYGVFSKVAYVQFRGAGISDEAGARLRMTNVNPEDTQKLISLVREHMK